MKNQESQIARIRFEAMPSELKGMIRFCTDAVEWSLNKRWRGDGDVVSFRKRITGLYNELNNESYDDENLGSKLFQNSDLYNRLLVDFLRLKDKYEPKSKLLKDQYSQRWKNGKLDNFVTCYEYDSRYDFYYGIEKEGMYTPDEIRVAMGDSFGFNRYEFENKEKWIYYKFTFDMRMGENCAFGHQDRIQILVEVGSTNGRIEDGFEIEVQEVYSADNYAEGSFDKNDFYRFYSENYSKGKNSMILPNGKILILSKHFEETTKHVDDNCCQRDLRLSFDNGTIDDLKEIAQIFLKYFIEHPKQKK